ncbi:penicillin-binding transpeptidase domain-containing protein [Haloplasma contractile]|uniref:penicillin-binding transpeptidase domain-containing protein n=1 Tax=Haloplasma contractile TaxID=471825 RepID=UPI000212163B|nr:penicillin-binding transpeptidase domain-containing protein [Haloplasma contractile]
MGEDFNRSTKQMIKVMMVIYGIIALALIIRFSYIATVHSITGHDLLTYSDHLEEEVLKADRGKIFDRNGSMLAINVEAYTLQAILDTSKDHYVKDKELTAKTLSGILACDEEELRKYLNKPYLQVEFAKCGRINLLQKLQIEETSLPGMIFTKRKERFYPNDRFASHTLGLVSIDELDEMSGILGIEQSMNDELDGVNGYKRFKRDSKGRPLPTDEYKIKEPIDGNNVYLTLDSTMQLFVEEALTKAYEDYGSKELIAVVADAKSGAIYAIGNRPTFNPNQRDIKGFYNNAFQLPYEPGSIMKPYVYAAAMEEGVYQGDHVYHTGRINVYGHTIHDWNWDKEANTGGWGPITLDVGLMKSSNVGIATILEDYLDLDIYLEYMKAFGFGRSTNMNLPNEKSGILPGVDQPFSILTSGFGQGMTSTPIQHIKAFSSFINDGNMVTPYIVSHVMTTKGNLVRQHEPTYTESPISKETANKMLDLLVEVVNNEEAVAGKYRLDSFTVAGKTGTAQIAEEGRYLEDEYYYSFIGTAPSNNPRLIVYVSARQVGENSPTSDMFKDIMEKSLIYLGDFEQNNVPIEVKGITIDDYTDHNVLLVEQELTSLGIDVLILGNGNRVVNQSIKKNGHVSIGGKLILLTEGNDYRMLDLTGWALRDVVSLANLLELDVNYTGHGIVYRQSIYPDTVFKEGDSLTVYLNDNNR